jgi:putative tryptophan/tyrosine transport system substrate-binding protein
MRGARWPGALSRRQLVQGAGAMGLAAGGIALLARCAVLAPPRPPPPKVARVGWLWQGSPADTSDFDNFREGMREKGWVEGQNFVVEARYADGREERYPALAAELIALPVDVILTSSTPAIRAAREATSTLPIVFAAIGDPVRQGFVASYARPGGNLTGLTILGGGAMEGKRLELLEAVPAIVRVAHVSTPTTAGNIPGAQEAARMLGVELQLLAVRTHDDLESAFAAASGWGADALLFAPDAVFGTARGPIATLAAQHRLPAMYAGRQHVDSGGLMAYGPQVGYNWRRAADYVDKILKGAKPADLPVEQPREFEFVINHKTAQALGLTIPPHVLLQATEVIQ